MPYIYVETLEEGQEPADVVERAEFDSLNEMLGQAQDQRDQAIERAVNAESDYSKMRQKYADTFLRTPSQTKPAETANLPQSLEELFG